MIAELHFLSALLALASVLLILRGFYPFWKTRSRDAVSSMAAGLVVMTGVICVRTLYWGIIPPIVSMSLGPDVWDRWETVSGGRRINIAFNLATMVATYHILRALWLLIPPGERSYWSVLTAPFYPNKWNLLVRTLSFMAQRHAVEKKDIDGDQS